MKIVCLHGQRSLQIALFLPPWGFGNCRWFHIFISLLHPMREFQQLLCNLWLNWSWLYCQCSVFLGEVFSMGILWRAPNSLDAIFQTDKFSFFSYALIWCIPGSEVINLLSVGACPETKRKIFLGFFYAYEMGFKIEGTVALFCVCWDIQWHLLCFCLVLCKHYPVVCMWAFSWWIGLELWVLVLPLTRILFLTVSWLIGWKVCSFLSLIWNVFLWVI
jgi:hypothetical protein